MRPFLEQSMRFVRDIVSQGMQQYRQVISYFKTHRKQRLWALAGLMVFSPPLIFLVIVWIELPTKRALRNIQNQVASEVYSADSVLLGRYYIQDRTEVKYEEIAPVVIDALIATEDIRFYEHSGVDYKSLGRVLVKSIFMQDESSGGGSTITQQLAKNLFPRKRYWLLAMPINKMREFITAARLENIYSKEELLTLYLNTIPFGDLTFGIQSAAKRFYSSTASALNVNQAALLIGMLKATHTYNPRLFPDRALQRRNVVLAQMAKNNFLDETKLDSLKSLPLQLEFSKSSSANELAPYFKEYLKTELQIWMQGHKKPDGREYNLYTDGLKIYTTLDSRLQQYAEEAVAQQMKEVQQLFFNHWGKELPWKGNDRVVRDAVQRSRRYKQLKEAGHDEDKIMKIFDTPVPMRIFIWQGDKDVVMKPIDSVKHHLQFLNAGFLAVDPQDGAVKAWVGGIDYSFFQYDHVRTSTKRQVGSIFKPIVYATAIEQGFDPCELISASRPTYIDDEGVSWTPRNTQNDYEVNYSMRGALAYSVNTVAAKVIQQAGIENTIAMAQKMGITSPLPKVPSIALGSASVSLMEMTAAYAVFANDGTAVPLHSIASIEDLNGNKWTDFKPKNESPPVASKETITLTLRMLQSVVHEGTASRLRGRYAVYNDVAGKTGTTQSNADGWFMAVTPKLVVGTWVGSDDPRIRFRSTELGQGSSTALPMFAYFMRALNTDPLFKDITQAKFPTVPAAWYKRMDCDLYELDSALVEKIKVLTVEQDSLYAQQYTDSLSAPRKESFLEFLYRRKLKIQMRNNRQDSLLRLEREVDFIEGN
jgi:penicillin-binding protein 1A